MEALYVDARASKVFPPRREPCDEADHADDTNGGAGVVHVVFGDRLEDREVKGDGGEDKEDETYDVEWDAPCT